MLRGFFVFVVVLLAWQTLAVADNREKAFKLFEDSDKAYKSGKFETAVDLLRKAYRLYPEPILLYNLGRAQEGLGDMKGAVESYERYLKTAKEISDRGAIERRVATLKAQLDAQSTEEEERRRREEEDRRKAEEDRRRREEEDRRRAAAVDDRTPLQIYGPWATMGAGGAILGTGIVFGILASAKHDDAVAAAVQRDAVELQRGAEQYATVANVLFVLGGLAAIGGGVWEYFEWKARPSTTAHLKIAPTSIAFEWVFP